MPSPRAVGKDPAAAVSSQALSQARLCMPPSPEAAAVGKVLLPPVAIWKRSCCVRQAFEKKVVL